MEKKSFSEIGVVEAVEELYKDSGFTRCDFIGVDGHAVMAQRMFLEGIDFNLVYFPMKHLGYKCVVEVVGELYAQLAKPCGLSLVLGVSSKLDFPQVSEIWKGAASAAREHGIKSVKLELQPSGNGLFIAVSALGEGGIGIERPAPQSKDLICVSGSLGAAYLGLRLLEKGADDFAKTGKEPSMEAYRMIVGDYLHPELDAALVDKLHESGIVPSCAQFLTKGLAHALKRICRDTGLGAKVYAQKIPFEGNSFQLGRELDIDPVSAAMNGGDDCRLLFVIPIGNLERFRHDFQTFDIIGHLALPEVGAVLVTPEGVEMPVKAQGWPQEF